MSVLQNLKRKVATLADLKDGSAARAFPSGKSVYLDPVNGNDNNDGASYDNAFKSFSVAYAALESHKGDTLYYISSSSGINLSASTTWALSGTNFVGVCAGGGVANRSRFFQLSTATGVSPLFNVTGSNNYFENLYWFHGVADATSLIDVQVTGSRNYFNSCHFAGGGDATMAIDGGMSLKLNGASENRFDYCTIGVDTIAAATGYAALVFDGSASRNAFNDCRITIYAGNSGARLVELVDATAVDRWTEFNRCTFFSNSTNKATTIASAFEIPNGHTTTATIFLNDCRGLGFTDWDDDDRGILYLDSGTITGGGNAGFAVVAAAT